MPTSILDTAIAADAPAVPATRDTPVPDRVTAAPVVEVAVECGPAVGPAVPLAPGRHVIGRARGAAIRIADRSVEPHHALLDVSADGVIAVVPLTGRTPLLDGDRPRGGSTRLVAGSTIAIGATRLRIGPPSPAPPPVRTGVVPGDGAVGRMVLREPRAVPFLAIGAIEPPADDHRVGTHGSHPGMLVGALAGVTGGLVMALVTGSSTVLLLGIVASVASFATWFVSRVRHIREVRRRRRRRRDDVDAFRAAVTLAAERIRTHHEDTLPGVGRRLVEVDGRHLWGRRAGHGDAFTVSLGRGDIDRPVPIGGDTLVDHELLAIVEPLRTLTDVEVPVRLDATPRSVVAVEGPGADAIIRSLVVQLAIATGPADWCGRAIVRDPDRCAWITGLPHAAVGDANSSVVGADDAAAVAELVQRLDDGDDRRVVVVCDAPALLATRTSPLRRLLDGDRPVTILLAVADGSGLPAVCGAVLRTGAGPVAHWTSDLHDGAAAAAWAGIRVRPSGITLATAERVASRLEQFVDPEDPSAGAGRLPRELRLDALPGVPRTAADVLDRWAAGGDDPPPAAVIGASADGVIELDLVRDGPHGLVAGTTGSGKSELLRTLVVQLAARVDPRHLSLVLVDYKGGSTFDACAELPHVVGLVTDLDGGLAARALTSLEAELHRRERILRDHRAADLTAYRTRPDVDPLPRLLVVIDELAALAK
ncbi:MAG: FtsK/SpoIIIE domain-containing protein, partial [Ilumatobacteraceae bacterium]